MASSSPTANPPQPANNDNMTSNDTSSTMADTGFSDESLDRDWKPNGRRPQSYVLLSPWPNHQGITALGSLLGSKS